MYNFVELNGEDGIRLFVKASYRDIEDYDINLIILKEGETVTCYEGSITSELRAVMGKNLKKDSDVIREYIDVVFKSKCDQGESFVYSLKDSTFIWKKVLGNRKVKLLIAKIPLNKRDILSEQNKFFSQGIDSLNHLQKESSSLSKLVQMREKEVILCKSLNTQMTNGMEEYEESLQGCLLSTLHSKQDENKKILKKIHGESYKDMEDDDYDVDTDVEENIENS